ncbi:MAG: hypothetical protein AAF768_07075 [Pseudomonadota bacterium]
MSLGPNFLDFAQSQGDLLIARVVSRDDLQLAPVSLSKAAAARLKRGIRALEAYLRRVLLCLALAIEPDLEPDNRPRNPCACKPNLNQRPGFNVLGHPLDCPDLSHLVRGFWADPKPNPLRGEPVLAAPLVARLNALKTLLEAPAERAKRLAFFLARRRPGPLLAPGRNADVPRRWGTELSMLYEGMVETIRKLSQARPPPLGPVPLMPPRIRML